MKKIILYFIAVLFLTSCGKEQKTISISGAFALYPLAVKWAEEYQKIHPEVRIDISAGGAGKGMTDALAKQVNLGMVSRDVTPEEVQKGAWYVAVTKDAVVPTYNSANPYSETISKKGLKKSDFAALWADGKSLTWGEWSGNGPKDEIKVYTRSDASGAAESWAKYFGKKQDDLKGTGVFGDPGLAEAVKKDVYGVGYNNVIYVYDLTTKKPYEGIRVIPIDINENGQIDPEENFYENVEDINKAIADGKYPSPPARELFFVSNGKPEDEAVQEFLNWILTDGQKFVKESGFINLQETILEESKAKLK